MYAALLVLSERKTGGQLCNSWAFHARNTQCVYPVLKWIKPLVFDFTTTERLFRSSKKPDPPVPVWTVLGIGSTSSSTITGSGRGKTWTSEDRFPQRRTAWKGEYAWSISLLETPARTSVPSFIWRLGGSNETKSIYKPKHGLDTLQAQWSLHGEDLSLPSV